MPNQAGDAGDTSPIDVPCQCSDADPRRDIDQEVGTTCFFHRVYGACNADFMFDANAELAPEGFCQISCSRCSCCVSPSEIIASLGGNRFLQAAAAAQPPLTDMLSHPGFVGTILVPSDAAFDALQAQLGPLAQNPAVLQQIVKMHILPPEARRNALWTSPFMVLGPKIRTMYDGPAVLTAQKVEPYPAGVTWQGGLTGFTLTGPHNAATVVKSDVPACKSYVTVIDTVLLPFDPAAVNPSNDFATAAGVAVGATGCALAPNALIRGAEVKSGTSNIQPTIGECCASCQTTPGCNAWVYCSQAGGCAAADGSYTRPFGACELKSSPEVAAGNAPSFEDYSATTVAASSGYLVRNVQAAGSAGRRLMAESGAA